MTAAKPVYLCAPRRTPIGSFSGALSTVPAPRLGAAVIRAVVAECGVPGEAIDGAIFGCVLTAGQGQAPTRQAVLYSGLPNTVQAMTVNKVCSSGLVALTLAANEIRLGLRQAVVAGGMESMSLAPYLAPKLRTGARLGHTQMLDSILADGLWDVYKDVHMGVAGELCAKKFSLDRNAQDQFALESYRRANQAIASGAFAEELVGVEVGGAKETTICAVDEEPAKLKPEKMAQLKPAFDSQGTVTAGNASSLSDGAAGMLVCSEEFVKTHNLRPLARLVEQGWHAQEPEWFTTAPVGAVEMVLQRAGITKDAIDLFEINEAFSSVALACAHSLEIDQSRLNVCGGAVALGHPIGASGARIVTTLVRSLHRLNKRYGVAAICNGGGEATSLLVERI